MAWLMGPAGLAALCLGTVLAGPVAAASADSSAVSPPAAIVVATPGLRPVVRAVRTTEPVAVDGLLGEAVWQSDVPFNALVQRDPREGARPSQRTEVRVAYDDAAIYVGARLFDTAPDSILARLARRDASIGADRFAVYLDPYHDRRSGYYFMVNAAGTLYDGELSNDVEDDKSWDGVWEAKARRDEQGWTAEMRIPYSQLRFEGGMSQVWGINFMREIPRHREKDFAAYRPKKASGFVSRFPDLVGIEDLRPHRSLAVMPYLTTQGEYLDHEPEDPLNDGSRLRGNAGADLRMGVGNGLTLNASVNPDFGQVEVDPSVVNLTDVESYFEEKRPFFTEGASVFSFGRQGAGDYWDYDWDDPLFFYSRRIGRELQSEVEKVVDKADYARVPVAMRILGAAKVIGRVSSDWSIGTLHALTKRETAQLVDNGLFSQAEIQPLTYYGVTRAQREVAQRRAGVGFMATLADRSFDDPSLRRRLNSASFLGGIDGWVFLDGHETWVLSGWTAVSHVRGDPSRLIDLQRSSTHYFQRVDAAYVGVDSSAQSLTGLASRYWINKQKGATQFNAAVGVVSPSFEVNDLGYQKRSDIINLHVGTGYKWTKPRKHVRYQSVKGAVFGTRDYDGNRTKLGVRASGYSELHSGFAVDYFAGVTARALNNRRTRGGPLTVDLPGVSAGIDLQTDSQRKRYYYMDLGAAGSQSGSNSFYAYAGVEFKPSGRFSLRIGPGWERVREDAQYVTSITDPTATATYGRRYVLARLDQNTGLASIRLNWTFSPQLSVQTYAQPYVSSARYGDFKSLVRPRSYEFTPTTYGTNLDFTSRSFKANTVLRWEYRPGSALFLVWTHKRSQYETVGQTAPQPGFLTGAPPDNIFAVKASYYFTP
jgi:uncharacterized protein DUF5916/cellulose/xylan binding protein with CBM9 domain